MKVVTRAFLRYLFRRRSLTILQLLGVACGVAAAVGMVFSAQSALSGFSRAIDFLKGRSTHTFKRSAGAMDERLLSQIMRDPAVEAFSPAIDRRVSLSNGEVVRLLGIDPLLDRAIRPAIATISFREKKSADAARAFFFDENAVFIDSYLSEHYNPGSPKSIATSRGTFSVVGTFVNPSSEPLILMDIVHAQKHFRLPGKVDYVDLILNDPQGFQRRWETGFVIQSRKEPKAALHEMLKAFRLNLEALSLVALLVGVFLVYNTAMFTVVSRRKDAAVLRSLGASRRDIVVAFLAEMLLLGGLGGALGGIAGYWLSRVLIGILGKTISSLYFFLTPGPPEWSWLLLGFGIFLGVGASLAGGFFPLVELVRTEPVKALHGRIVSAETTTRARNLALTGVGVIGLSLVCFFLSTRTIYFGFGGVFLLLLGASFLTGIALVVFTPVLRLVLHWLGGFSGTIAAGNIEKNLGRTAVATAAFMVALSMVVGMGLMIGSFRHSLVWWMDSQIKADLYVAPSSEVEVPEEFYNAIKSEAGIGGVDRYRNVQILYRNFPVSLTAIDPVVLQKFTPFTWIKGGRGNWDSVKKGEAIVSESFYRRFGSGAGDTITLKGNRGPVTLKIGAVFYDYTTEQGLIMIDRALYLKIFQDPTIDTLAVFLDKKSFFQMHALEVIRKKAREWELPVVTQKELHENILRVFDSTFAVTRAMRLLAVMVAFFGIAGAILILFLERQKEFGIYRALGFSPFQVAGMTLMESLGMGLMSFLLSTVLGTALAVVLIRVINYYSFNWTIFYHHLWGPYLASAGCALVAGIGASLYPIIKISRTYPHLQIREE